MSRFVNPHILDDRRSLRNVLLWSLKRYDEDAPLTPPPSDFVYPFELKPVDKNQPTAVWVGHSTFLIQCNGFNVLTDPVWSSHCCPLPIPTFKRLHEPPFPIAALPRLDVVLISHNHYDHLDLKSVQAIFKAQPHVLWIVPKRLSNWFYKCGIKNCVELGWWDSLEVGDRRITAVPAQHFSGRTLWDKNKSHWNGYVTEIVNKKFYFVGDTGYNAHDFKKIGEKFAPIDLSLIPIGAYAPKKMVCAVHCNPAEGVEIHKDVGSRLSLGMHWNTFCLTTEPINRPPYDLFLAMQQNKISFDDFIPIDVGVHINW